MMKSGAPPYKVGVLYHMLHIEFHGFTSRTDFEGLSLFSFWSYLNLFRDGMVPFKEALHMIEQSVSKIIQIF